MNNNMKKQQDQQVEEFQEEDVWNCFVAVEDDDYSSAWHQEQGIPMAEGLKNDGKTFFSSHHKTFAPVKILDWSKKRNFDQPGNFSTGAIEIAVAPKKGGSNFFDDEFGEELIPPHEFVAKRLARGSAAHSMCEGIGGTLKGRELCRVRNEILMRTGFIEP